VVSRVCLDALRARQARRREELPEQLPDPVVSRADQLDPEQQALVSDSVGLALLVVLESLTPQERLAFVLHDTFGVPFEEIAPLVGRSPAAARQLASRARRRVRGSAPEPDRDPVRQRQLVDAFLAAAQNGDFEALVAVLDPDVVLRADVGALGRGVRLVRGARAVAGQAVAFRRRGYLAVPALVNGAAGLVNTEDGRPVSVMSFTVSEGRIAEIDILADPARVDALDLSFVGQ
jgi:RNA polymerase sigma-70 factor (ECF subfamily)